VSPEDGQGTPETYRDVLSKIITVSDIKLDTYTVYTMVMKRYVKYSHRTPRINSDEFNRLWPRKLLCSKCLLRKPKSESLFVVFLKIRVGSTKIRGGYNLITNLSVYEPSWIYLYCQAE
jgi:hypothetical protein